MKDDSIEVVRDPERLSAVRRTGLLDADAEEAFDRLTRLAVKVIGSPIAFISLVDEDRDFYLSHSGFGEPLASTRELAGSTFCHYTIRGDEPLLIRDTRADPVFRHVPTVESLGVAAYAGFPLVTANGHIIGSFCMIDFEPREWTSDDVEILSELGMSAMREIELRGAIRLAKQKAEEASTARREAEAASRAKSEFLSRMSHELRTPLNAILGFGQLLAMDPSVEDQESVSHVLRAGRHLLRLIDGVLDIARIEAGRMNLSMEPVGVRELLEETLSLVRQMATHAGIALDPESLAEAECLVWADQQRLKQVMLNLLSNAIKYNCPGGTVTLSCRDAAGESLRIEVRDTGRGIPLEKVDRLFTPFDRLDAEKTEVEGSGLGLAISRALVDAMGGELGVDSMEGTGSTFWVRLPRPAPGEAMPGARGSRQHRPAGEPIRTILLVEDDLANGRLMEHVFRTRPGVRVLTAMQGRRALELAQEYHPDLVILDLNLPDLSGDQVLLELQQDPTLRDVPVVMISGAASNPQVERLLSLGARAFLAKPFELRELLRIADEALGGSD